MVAFPEMEVTMEETASLENMPELVILSGMSGAGRTEAMHVFEDLGYYCVDNLPPQLIRQLVDVATPTGESPDKLRVAVVCDARSRGFFEDVVDVVESLAKEGIGTKIVFLDAEDEKLIARYKSSRRRHPLCSDGATISHGIERERSPLREMRSRADYVIDTMHLLPA